MGRDTSPHIIGPFWLDHRPDAKSKAWQIAHYDSKARTVRYRSTGCTALDDAVVQIDAHYAATKAKGQQDASAAVVPQLLLYWEERGQHAVSPDQIASSMRSFIGFLVQDEATLELTFEECTPGLFRRFASWRMAAHGYTLDWKGRRYTNNSKGLSGVSMQRVIDDIRAALNHAASEGRVPYAPKVPSVDRRFIQQNPPRILTVAEMASIIGYALDDRLLLRFVLAQVATLTRPEAVRAWRPWEQADLMRGVIDTHPRGWPRTKKRNPILIIPRWWQPWLAEWIASGESLPVQMRRRWNTMRRALGLSSDVEPKTIRRSMATWLGESGVPELEIKQALGHAVIGSTGRYMAIRPEEMAILRTTQEGIWISLMFAVRSWRADHLRTTDKFGGILIEKRTSLNLLIDKGKSAVGGEGFEPPALSV
ncbi:site-specific integrase [Sandarakinorhabdus sp.]|uniref:site-specific integrase n=1 Tax=Sandarakinorhabdus sp. TaxID=1916663 RepID=UPI003F70BC84